METQSSALMDGMAAFNLGEWYFKGIMGKDQDYEQAAKWYRQALDKGVGEAAYPLAVCFENGWGVAKDTALAVKLYMRAADIRDIRAMCKLGNCYFRGSGAEQDYAEALRWYSCAANLGNADAMIQLGNCYYKGLGVRQDVAEAAQWYHRAAKKGYAVAMARLGTCYFSGVGVEQDYTQAVQWYRRAAALHNNDGMFNLANCYYNGTGLAQNYTQAMEWYRRAADNGDASAMFNLARYGYQMGNGVASDMEKAARWYRRAAEQGEVMAMICLAYCYELGEGVDKDIAEAYRYYVMAAGRGNDYAQQAVSRLGPIMASLDPAPAAAPAPARPASVVATASPAKAQPPPAAGHKAATPIPTPSQTPVKAAALSAPATAAARSSQPPPSALPTAVQPSAGAPQPEQQPDAQTVMAAASQAAQSARSFWSQLVGRTTGGSRSATLAVPPPGLRAAAEPSSPAAAPPFDAGSASTVATQAPRAVPARAVVSEARAAPLAIQPMATWTAPPDTATWTAPPDTPPAVASPASTAQMSSRSASADSAAATPSPIVTTLASTVTSSAAGATGKQPWTFTIDDVCAWLASVRLGHLADAFRRHRVDGEVLVSLQPDDYQELEVTAWGDRRKLEIKIRDLIAGRSDDSLDIPATPVTPTVPTPLVQQASTALLQFAAPAAAPWMIRRNDVDLEQEIGTGSLGAVYRGIFHGSRVAIKTAVGKLDPAKHDELRSEAEIMQSIPGHANILQFFGACFDDQGVLLVTELCDAGSLDWYLVQEPHLGADVRLALCEQVAAGMSHLEYLCVVHRDLAARNILLKHAFGSDGRRTLITKVADFSKACKLESPNGVHAVRDAVAIRWMAPEVLDMAQHGLPADVWSFGVLCWEIFSPPGVRPFGQLRNYDEVIEAVVRYRQTLAAPVACHPAVWQAVRGCFAYDPKERPTFTQLHGILRVLSNDLLQGDLKF